MAKPNTFPRWQDVGGTRTTPTSGKLDVGFAAKEKPPAQFLNWLFYWLYQWIVFLAGLTTKYRKWSPGDGYIAFIGSPTLPTAGAWLATTAYAVGDRVHNGGTVRVYQCITAGTSAGAGGPTTTAADITDNTVHWTYVCDGVSADSSAIKGTNNGAILIPVPLLTGERLLSLTVYLFEGSAASHVSMSLIELDEQTGVETTVNFTGPVATVTATGAIGSKVLAGNIDGAGYTLALNYKRLVALVQFGANGGAQVLRGILVNSDTP
jgi:hypothetical protein